MSAFLGIAGNLLKMHTFLTPQEGAMSVHVSYVVLRLFLGRRRKLFLILGGGIDRYTQPRCSKNIAFIASDFASLSEVCKVHLPCPLLKDLNHEPTSN